MNRLSFVLAAALLLGIAPARIAAAAEFPPVTEQERALTSVANDPSAPAVILFKKSELLMMGYGAGGELSSSLQVKTRVKILTQDGMSYGEVSIPHNSIVRLQSLTGRTVLPDGRILPLPADAKFERKLSRRQNRSVTSVAFPGVEPGAILDYQYELRFDTFYYLEPWYFSDELPVVFSEVTFKIPKEVQAKAWSSDPFKAGVKNETRKTNLGTEVRVWAENLPAVPNDPYGLPFNDLSTQMMLLPTVYSDPNVHLKLLESWESLFKLLDEGYDKALRKDGGAVKKAREIAARAGAGPRAQAEAVYRFVRDEIATEYVEGVFLDQNSSVARTLSDQSGDYLEKAMLLKVMLQALKIDAKLVWAADRWRGQIDPELANPAWFDRVLVVTALDGQRVFLDPSDSALAFGFLRSAYEGTPAVVYDLKKPERLILPETSHDQNFRKAVVDLTLDGEGRLAGTGELVLTGHFAWEKIDWRADDEKTLEAWKEWLVDEWKGFTVADIRFEELPDERKVRLTWSLKQREEEVLGDEVTLAPSRPLGPTGQPLQPADKRRSPVLFSYGDVNEVETRLRWPEGWEVEAKPAPRRDTRPAGVFTVELETNGTDRLLIYRRRFEMRIKKTTNSQEYEGMRAIFAAAEKSDAQALVLVKR